MIRRSAVTLSSSFFRKVLCTSSRRFLCTSSSATPRPKKMSVLKLKVVGAKELPRKTTFYRSVDPYLVMKVNDHEILTGVIPRTTDPLWAEEYYFEWNKDLFQTSSVDITVMDRDFGKEDDVIGTLQVPLQDIGLKLRRARRYGTNKVEGRFFVKPPPVSEEELKDAEGVDIEKILEERENPSLSFNHGRLYLNFEYYEDWDPDRNTRTGNKLVLPIVNAGSPRVTHYHEREREKSRPKRLASWERDVDGVTTTRDDRVEQMQRDMMKRIHEFEDIENPPKRNFRILSIDGGGVRGVVVCVILQALLRKFPTLLQEIDVIAGTSTGGMLAALLGSGYSPASSLNIYKLHAREIFEYSASRSYNPWVANYSSSARLNVFERYIGDRMMSDLLKYVIITSFKVDASDESEDDRKKTFFPGQKWRPAVFTNIPIAQGSVEPDMDETVVDIAMRTSAAPTYFPLHQGYADGGLFAHNPSLVAFSRLCHHFHTLNSTNVAVLSLGTGNFRFNVDLEGDLNADWGLRQWAPHLLNVLMDGAAQKTDLALNMVLQDKYHRLEPFFEEYKDLDNVDQIPEAIKIASELNLDSTYEFVKDHFGLVPSSQK